MTETRSALDVVLLVVHIVGAILFIGPAAVANSVFPQYLRGRLMGTDKTKPAFAPDLRVMTALHRISLRFGRNALLVPVAGAGLAISRGRFDEAWLWSAIGVTVVAAALLVVTVREQRAALVFVRAHSGSLGGSLGGSPAREEHADAIADLVRRAGTRAGQFNLAWVVILVLMVWRPGSSG